MYTFFFSLFRAASAVHAWKFPGQGLNQSCSCRPTPQPHQILATSVTYAAACNSAGS